MLDLSTELARMRATFSPGAPTAGTDRQATHSLPVSLARQLGSNTSEDAVNNNAESFSHGEAI